MLGIRYNSDMLRLRFWLSSAILFAAVAVQSQTTLTLLHTNDLHAHVEPTAIRGKFYGGYARQATLIKRLRASEPNTLLLNGGDTFQGTLYFNVYEGMADLAFMNAAGYDAMAVGNHEFDKGPAALTKFAKWAAFPLLSANLDLTLEPELDQVVSPYVIKEVNGIKVGIIGATTVDLLSISSPGPNVKMLDLEKELQSIVDELTRKRIYHVILVSHCGYEEEKVLASRIRGLDVIVGGHSHSMLGKVDREGFISRGDYPTVVKNPTGSDCLVVQAWEWGKVLGKIRVKFNKIGRVSGYEGAEPIVIDDSIPEDQAVKSMLLALEAPILELKTKVVGSAAARLSRNDLGGIIADAMLAGTAQQGSQIAFMNPGGVRSDLEPGDITYGAAISVQPFGNTMVVLDLTGKEITDTLEQMIMRNNGEGSPMHASKGFEYKIDRSAPAGSKITNASLNGIPIVPTQTYRIVTNNFMANGGDGMTIMQAAKGTRIETGFLDLDVFLAYIKANSPIRKR